MEIYKNTQRLTAPLMQVMGTAWWSEGKVAIPAPFFEEGNESARCLYFENAVLPSDDQLKARYWNRFGLVYWEASKVCKRCENPFEPNDQREQFCSECKAEQRREKDRIRKREQRKKERQQTR